MGECRSPPTARDSPGERWKELEAALEGVEMNKK